MNAWPPHKETSALVFSKLKIGAIIATLAQHCGGEIGRPRLAAATNAAALHRFGIKLDRTFARSLDHSLVRQIARASLARYRSTYPSGRCPHEYASFRNFEKSYLA